MPCALLFWHTQASIALGSLAPPRSLRSPGSTAVIPASRQFTRALARTLTWLEGKTALVKSRSTSESLLWSLIGSHCQPARQQETAMDRLNGPYWCCQWCCSHISKPRSLVRNDAWNGSVHTAFSDCGWGPAYKTTVDTQVFCDIFFLST